MIWCRPASLALNALEPGSWITAGSAARSTGAAGSGSGSGSAAGFRGGGRLCVENLHYLATKHSSEARSSLRVMAERGKTPDGVPRSFPWACASINVTSVLAALFTDEAIGCPLWPAALALRESSFDELHSVAFMLLVQYFVEMPGATYFDFNRVLGALKHACGRRCDPPPNHP